MSMFFYSIVFFLRYVVMWVDVFFWFVLVRKVGFKGRVSFIFRFFLFG